MIPLISFLLPVGCSGADNTERDPSSEGADAPADKPLPEPAAPLPTGAMRGTQLDAAQAAALKSAYLENPVLTAGEAREFVGYPGQLRTQGFDASEGDCSHISLSGLIDGTYSFTQRVYPSSGVALFGNITISTNGFAADYYQYDPVGANQKYSGDLRLIGWFPSGHTMDGWMFTSKGYLCVGDLFARW
ncbi:MAG TPA: hypothetical protein VFK05_22100 [Polyangiaceae bacterium]|nr:hypothetical protein [Polyangiaceae bacterium]